jgi:hypothetical protein
VGSRIRRASLSILRHATGVCRGGIVHLRVDDQSKCGPTLPRVAPKVFRVMAPFRMASMLLLTSWQL